MQKPRALIDRETLQQRVTEMAQEITRDYAQSEVLSAVGVLKGSVYFMVDLTKQIPLPMVVDFFQTSSYSGGKVPGEVRIRKDVDELPQFPEDVATGHAAWTDWPWKLHRINGKKYELYNLAEDPMESKDRSTEGDQQPRVERMKRELHGWMRSVVGSLNGKDYDLAD